jgi:hypothetical protein
MKRLYLIQFMYLVIVTACQTHHGINVSDSFESENLSKIWSTERFLPGAVEIQSAIVKSGSNAIRITLHPGDQIESEKETILERAELQEAVKLVSVEDSGYIYSFSMFLPQDFPIIPTRLVIAQWKQYCQSGNCSIDNPVIALRYESGEFKITLKTNPEKITLYSQKEDIRNKWLNFKFQILFARNQNGRIKVWLNDREIINYAGITAYSQEYGYPDPGYFYFKMGLYRDQTTVPMSIYIDDYKKQELVGLEQW